MEVNIKSINVYNDGIIEIRFICNSCKNKILILLLTRQ